MRTTIQMKMQITEKDLQHFRERAKTELQSNGAVGRLAWDAVVNALCNEVEELRKDAAISNAVDSAWAGVCAACAEGTPPERCAYYGEPNGCNAPKIGQHPTAHEELNKAANICLFVKENCGNAETARYMAEAIVAINEAVASLPSPGNVTAMREALESCLNFIVRIDRAFNPLMQSLLEDAVAKAKAALAAPPRNCDRFATANDAVEAYIAAHPHGDEPDASTYGSWLFAKVNKETK